MVKTILKYKEQIYLYLTYLIIFLFSVFPYSDKDWGWHFKLGEYLLKNGHMMTDNPYTWTLPYFQWTNHEWLYDPLLYLLTKSVGFLGLSLLGGIVSFATFYIITRLFKLEFWKIAILGFFFVRISEVGVIEGLRSQVISTFLLGVLMFILIKSVKNIKFLFVLPPLFLFWANMHGTFTLGLLVATVYLGSNLVIKLVKKEKDVMNTLLIYGSVGLISAVVTLLNPFGPQVYLEALKHASNRYLTNVVEWLPTTQNCNYCHEYTFFSYVLILVFIFFKTKKIENLPYFILGLIFLYPSINARRYLQNYVVITLPLLASYLETVKFDLNKFKSTNYLVILILSVGIIYNLFWRFTDYNLYNYKEVEYCRHAVNCSPIMADYIINNPPKGNGFNFYDWGGYYIGKGIPVRLFIDGRMHLWKLDDFMPFADYVAMYYDKDYSMFNNYKFDWVLVPLDSDIGKKIYNTDDLGKWKIEFQDGNTILYTRR